MIIVGIDGADYSIAKDYCDVRHLEVDIEPRHTAAIWTSYFTGLTPDEHRIRSWRPVIMKLPNFDYIWRHGNWTVFAAPVTMPPFCLGCSTSDYHMKDEESAWEIELKEFRDCYDRHTTDHFVGVVRCIDCASHARPKDTAIEWYKRVFEIIKEIEFDILVSDHGFWGFNRRKGEDDHSPDGIIRGVDVDKASDFIQYMKKTKHNMK